VVAVAVVVAVVAAAAAAAVVVVVAQVPLAPRLACLQDDHQGCPAFTSPLRPLLRVVRVAGIVELLGRAKDPGAIHLHPLYQRQGEAKAGRCTITRMRTGEGFHSPPSSPSPSQLLVPSRPRSKGGEKLQQEQGQQEQGRAAMTPAMMRRCYFLVADCRWKPAAITSTRVTICIPQRIHRVAMERQGPLVRERWVLAGTHSARLYCTRSQKRVPAGSRRWRTRGLGLGMRRWSESPAGVGFAGAAAIGSAISGRRCRRARHRPARGGGLKRHNG
jgi:hypothetical protein